jgi:hypothetical protein
METAAHRSARPHGSTEFRKPGRRRYLPLRRPRFRRFAGFFIAFIFALLFVALRLRLIARLMMLLVAGAKRVVA